MEQHEAFNLTLIDDIARNRRGASTLPSIVADLKSFKERVDTTALAIKDFLDAQGRNRQLGTAKCSCYYTLPCPSRRGRNAIFPDELSNS